MKKYFLLTTCWYNIIKVERKQVISSCICYDKTPADCLMTMYKEDKILFERKHMDNRSILRSEIISKAKADELCGKLNMRIYGE